MDKIDQIAKVLNVGNMFATRDTLQEAIDFGAGCGNPTVAMCVLMNTISSKLCEANVDNLSQYRISENVYELTSMLYAEEKALGEIKEHGATRIIIIELAQEFDKKLLQDVEQAGFNTVQEYLECNAEYYELIEQYYQDNKQRIINAQD